MTYQEIPTAARECICPYGKDQCRGTLYLVVTYDKVGKAGDEIVVRVNGDTARRIYDTYNGVVIGMGEWWQERKHYEGNNNIDKKAVANRGSGMYIII